MADDRVVTALPAAGASKLDVMSPLEPPDSHHLQAAQGWLVLGNATEANAELEEISAEHRAHPDVLQIRWQIYAKVQKWDACLDIATALTKTVPERRFGWIHRALSLHKLDRTAEAREVLLSVIGKFDPNPTLPYYLACFCCRLGHVEEAKDWLERAFKATASAQELDRLKMRALDDKDLEPLWRQIGQ